jgi:hypothetical protein
LKYIFFFVRPKKKSDRSGGANKPRVDVDKPRVDVDEPRVEVYAPRVEVYARQGLAGKLCARCNPHPVGDTSFTGCKGGAQNTFLSSA